MTTRPKPHRAPKASGRTMSQAERRAVGARVVVSMTLTPEALQALDKLRGKDSRGAYIEELLQGALR